MKPSNRTELVEVMARAINGSLEGPVNNQDATRQMRQWNLALALAADALTALEQAGCAVVPVEITDEMLDATSLMDGTVMLPWRYTAMLKAGPYARKE